MSHKYQHLRTLKDLDTEIALLRIRREVIKQEAMANIQNIGSGVTEKFTTIGILVWIAKTIYKSMSPSPSDGALNKIAHFAELISNLLNRFSKFRN
jgi:hypothetical protein